MVDKIKKEDEFLDLLLKIEDVEKAYKKQKLPSSAIIMVLNTQAIMWDQIQRLKKEGIEFDKEYILSQIKDAYPDSLNNLFIPR